MGTLFSIRSIRHRRRGLTAFLVAALLLAFGLQGCSGGSSDLTKAVKSYLMAWDHADYAAMRKMVDHPPADYVSYNQGVDTDLGVLNASFSSGPVNQNGDAATLRVTGRRLLRGLGRWQQTTSLTLRMTQGLWRVEWTPQSIDPALGPNDHIVAAVSWPPRAPILGAGGTPLTVPARMVRVGIEGSRITDPAQLTSVLEQAGVSAANVANALATATAHPQWFVPVLDVPQATYEQLRPTLYPVPGTVFQTHSARAALTADLGTHIVGSVGPITAAQLARLGSSYRASDVVGQTGIEQAYERQLAGTPGGTVRVTDATGNTLATVARFQSKTGTAVATTIDPAYQQAVEGALNGVAQPASMVVMRASTGEILASVSRPLTETFDTAVSGQYPPGSTFKVVTAADLIEHGLGPTSPATCPPTITVGDTVLHNFESEAQPSLSLAQAFAVSCNTAFIGLSSNLPDASFAPTAAQFGIGVAPHLGLVAFGGAVPDPTTDVERAATAIGQASVVVSPLAMATAAAAVDSGSLHEPRLVVGAPDDTVPSKSLDPTVDSDLKTMMAGVVANGTAAAAGLPSGTLGKTGTAEFGSGNPPQTHAWFVGFRGDIAFCVLVVGGGVGGAVAAPIAAKFLRALG